eukprot:TRINITY_DN3205_c0_g1_i1.p1 TRINITY_DN3205_c0_g1~~TRINITY_DN3205_c0_g1_i1.p1  ORF type:complete len:610 (-),score=145.76 TRINITY_DN3205_c0_g1_i1:101-1864(-)
MTTPRPVPEPSGPLKARRVSLWLSCSTGLLLLPLLGVLRQPVFAAPQESVIRALAEHEEPPLPLPHYNATGPTSAECLYRGWLQKGGRCHCVTVHEGPGFFGDRCEQTRCGHHSLAQCAQRVVTPRFEELREKFSPLCVDIEPGKECRALFMRLRDSLNIFGSAYFPMRGVDLTWHNIDRCLPYDGRIRNRKEHTSDPVVVLLQYTEAIYQALGDTEDAKNQRRRVYRRCREVSDERLRLWKKLLRELRIGGTAVTWDEYILDAGRQSWSVATPALLYTKARGGKAQFWGKLEPDPGLKCGENACILLSNEVYKTRERYLTLRDTQRHGRWWESVLDRSHKAFPNFETFHKIRKSIRTILNTYVQVPALSITMFIPLSPPLHQWLLQFSTRPVSPNATFGDVFCLGKPRCRPLTDVIALLLLDDRQQFPIHGFWNLIQDDYDYLRAIGTLGLGSVGSLEDPDLGGPFRPRDTGCPGPTNFSDFSDGSSRSISTPIRSWSATVGFRGTYCGLVEWMGVVHDRMIELNGAPHDRALRGYVSAESRAVGRYLDLIDFDTTVSSILEGLCYSGVRQREFPAATGPLDLPAA